MLQLNLGCGTNHFPNFTNVDKFAESKPDVQFDLETFPWPWADSSVDMVAFIHSLEHMGQDPSVFLGIMKEVYRICKDQALVQIKVPHPRHDFFYNDPTHVRPLTAAVFELFSKENCQKWAEMRASNSPLALYLDVDFEIIKTTERLDDSYQRIMDAGKIGEADLAAAKRLYHNVIQEIEIVLWVHKPGAPVAEPAILLA